MKFRRMLEASSVDLQINTFFRLTMNILIVIIIKRMRREFYWHIFVLERLLIETVGGHRLTEGGSNIQSQ